MMRTPVQHPVYVLSGSIGRGHDSVADACVSAFTSRRVASSALDCMHLLGGPGQRVGEYAFKKLLSVPPLFDAFHFSQLRAGSGLASSLESAAARRLVPALRHELSRSPGGGLLLSVFATGAGAAGRLTAGDDRWHTAVFCTDATAHRMWVQPGVDTYLVCSPTAAGTVLQYDPFAHIVTIPPPVRAPFFEVPDRQSARRQLGLSRTGPHVLMTAGGWGLGPVAEAADALARAGFHVLAVAGDNRKLERRLRTLAQAFGPTDEGSITPWGFTPRIPELMAASDVVVSTAGQTCHEARVVGRPLIVLDTVPGHGRENLLLEVARGGALACPPEPGAVVGAVIAVLDGALPASAPWPVSSAAEWQGLFLDAVADLLKFDDAA